jgi:putative oxidoreductase
MEDEMTYMTARAATRRQIFEGIQMVQSHIADWLARHSVTALRISLGLVFLGFGLLKFFPDLSPAAGLAGETFARLTFGLVPEKVGVLIVAAMETAIGLSLLTRRLLRFGLALLAVTMVGILSPLVLLPGELFRGAPWAPTLTGQYVLKDVVLMTAALVVASSAFGARRRGDVA